MRGGRVGFILSSTFFKTNAGQPLRNYLLAQTEIEGVVDFGDLRVFEGVTSNPAILVARRSGAPDGERALRFLNIRGRVPVDLARMFDETAETLQQRQLLRSAWQFEGDARSRGLERSLRGGHCDARFPRQSRPARRRVAQAVSGRPEPEKVALRAA